MIKALSCYSLVNGLAPSAALKILNVFLKCKTKILNTLTTTFSELEVGICSNQIIAIICQVLKYLRKFSFCGSDLTHPGVMSILERKSTLQQLCIQSPRYLTKYSMKLLSEEMSLLRTLKYKT